MTIANALSRLQISVFGFLSLVCMSAGLPDETASGQVFMEAPNISAGGYHSLFFESNGSLSAVGWNMSGQLGDGTYNTTNNPEQIETSNINAIAAGGAHSLFLESGSLWAMGNNDYGQLGDGSTNGGNYATNRPEEILGSSVIAIAAGDNHSLFLKADGSLWGMGDDRFGQLGDGGLAGEGTNQPEEIVPGSVVAIAAGGGHSLYLKSDGSLWAMGSNKSGELGDGTYNSNNVVEEILASNVTAIAAGGDFSLFLKKNGSLWAMGNNLYGQLGDGTTNNGNYQTNLPEEIVSNNVAAIAAGGQHSLFLKNDGSLWAMGDNQNGQLGDGGTDSGNYQTNLPEEIVSSNVIGIAAGELHSVFLMNDGSVWAMGDNDFGQLGDGTYISINQPIRMFPPGIQFAANPTDGEGPFSVQFISPGTDPQGNTITGWHWNFGDGSTAIAQNPSHLYTNTGNFYPILIATNNRGALVTGLGPPISVRPGNDDFASSIPLLGFDVGNNAYATTEPGEPDPGGGQLSLDNTIWWSWTAPTNGPASVQAQASNFPPVVDVYTGNSLSNLVCIASNLNNVVGEIPLENLTPFMAAAGTTYHVQVSGLDAGPIEIAVQPVDLVALLNQTNLNEDGSISFSATATVGNSGAVASPPLQLVFLASAGENCNKFIAPGQLPPSQILATYYFPSVAVGSTTNIVISGICPAPTAITYVDYCVTSTNWLFWNVYGNLNEEFGTNWFFADSTLVVNGLCPSPFLYIKSSPTCPHGINQFGVVEVFPSIGGSAPYFTGTRINGPVIVYQNTATNYYGTATFEDGEGNLYPVNFTNTVWTASKFSITGTGQFQAGAVTTNTPVTLTAYYTYDGSNGTNSTQLNILVLSSAKPSLSDWQTQTNKTFSLALNALPGSPFEIESTTNLSNPQWVSLATNTTDVNGVWFFTDTKNTNGSRRFYRALEIQ